MSRMQQLRDNPWYERIYKVGVGVKGFDGTVELVAGIWLWVAPQSLHALLHHWHVSTSNWHSALGDTLAQSIARFNHELYGGVLVMAIIFLISHGVIKLALVYALLREIIWAYPYALIVLGLFLVLQMYAIVRPGVGMAALIVLDVLIIWLVWGEWQKLKADAHHT